MTYVDDLYEPGDDREPDELETEFLDPEQLIEAIDDPQARATVEALLADVRYLRGLETREEWAWSDEPTAEPAPGAFKFRSAKSALVNATGRQVWRRTLTVHPWEPISLKAPF